MKNFLQWLTEMAAPTAEPLVRQILKLSPEMSLTAVAAKTGLNISTVKAVLRKHQDYHTSASTHSRMPPPEVIAQIVQGHDEGYTDEQLAQMYHLTPRDIRSIIVTSQPSRSPQLRQWDAQTGDFLNPKQQSQYNRFGKKLIGDDKAAAIIQAATQEYLNDLEIMRKFKVGRSTVRQIVAPYLTDFVKQKRLEHNKELMSKSARKRVSQ